MSTRRTEEGEERGIEVTRRRMSRKGKEEEQLKRRTKLGEYGREKKVRDLCVL